MEDIGHSLGPENQRQYRTFWKNIYEMREAGAHKILLYRSKEFDSFCRSYSKTAEISLVNKVLVGKAVSPSLRAIRNANLITEHW